jgi:hypothetical protein
MGFFVAGLFATAAAAQVSSADREAVETAARAAIERYYTSFSERNMTVLPGGVFNIPWIQVGNSGIRADTTDAQALAGFTASMNNLIGQGWEKSVFTVTHVCVPNLNVAIVSGYNTRYRTTGEEMSVGGVAYVLGKSDEGEWKIISYFGIARDQLIRCD